MNGKWVTYCMSFLCHKSADGVGYIMGSSRPGATYEDILGISPSLTSIEAAFDFPSCLRKYLGLLTSQSKLCPPCGGDLTRKPLTCFDSLVKGWNPFLLKDFEQLCISSLWGVL